MNQLPASLPTWAVVLVAVLVLVIVPVINGPAVVEWIKARFTKTDPPPAVEPPKPSVLEQAAAAGDFVAGRLLAEQDETAEYRRELREQSRQIVELLRENGNQAAEIARLSERVRNLEGRADDR
ncbi:hypothetical protein [Amycolatopsis magusensis]|uniref:hypothetical protein n=1 Tax=Amycolatopsis magusensis TaxID=882444 RepID=UPI003C2D1C1D